MQPRLFFIPPAWPTFPLVSPPSLRRRRRRRRRRRPCPRPRSRRRRRRCRRPAVAAAVRASIKIEPKGFRALKERFQSLRGPVPTLEHPVDS
jgi:hypothetical protein